MQVITSISDIENGYYYHAAITFLRFFSGTFLGIVFGMVLGIFMYKYHVLHLLVEPFLQSIRAVPAVAFIPFFLLWFGFSDIGKIILILVAIGVNIAYASYQILRQKDEKYQIALDSMRISQRNTPFFLLLALIAEKLLPTLRFSLVISIATIVTMEMLGSQSGLGYLIQNAQATFNLGLIMFSIIVLSLFSTIMDMMIIKLWKYIVYWK
jgi:ABC-type nitrate/sulfonate/bicarbonate transport system permease component